MVVQNTVTADDHMIVIKRRVNYLITVFLSIFIIFSIFPDFFDAMPASLSWYIGLGISVACFIASLFLKRIDYREIIFYLILILLLLFSSSFNGNIKMTIVFQYFRYIFVALTIARIKLVKAPLYILHLILCVFLLFSYLVLEKQVTEIMANGVSQNAISVHILFILALIIMAERKLFNRYILIATLLSFVVIAWTGCRSGLITISFLLLCSLLSGLKHARNRLLFGFVLAVLSIIGIIIASNTGLFEDMFQMISTRTQKFSENVRLKMISEFFEEATSDIFSFLFGPKLSDVPTIHYFGDNPHNSFINAYAKFGLAGFLLFMTLIIMSFIRYWQFKKSYFVLLLALCIRSFTDVTAFPNMYDVLFFFFIFEYPLLNKNVFIYKVKKSPVKECSYEKVCC